MKKYFHLITILALITFAVASFTVFRLHRNFTEATVTQQNEKGDVRYAQDFPFIQYFSDYDYENSCGARWELTTDPVNTGNSSVKCTASSDSLYYEDTLHDDGVLSLYKMTDAEAGGTCFSDPGLSPSDIEKDFNNEVIYNIIMDIASRSKNGEMNTETVTLKNYTDSMPVIINFDYFGSVYVRNETDDESGKAEKILRQAIEDQLPEISLTGKETLEISVEKGEDGTIRQYSIDNDQSMSEEDRTVNSLIYQSLQTDHGLYFTYTSDSSESLYYIPMERVVSESRDGYMIDADVSCQKLVTFSRGEKILNMRWNDDSNQLLLVSLKDGISTFSAYNFGETIASQTLNLFSKAGKQEIKADMGTFAVETGENLYVYMNSSLGLTALRYNGDNKCYEVLMDLSRDQAYGDPYQSYYDDDRSKVTYKDGKLAILSVEEDVHIADTVTDTDSMDEDIVSPEKAVLTILTEDGTVYIGFYPCSLIEDGRYRASLYKVSFQ